MDSVSYTYIKENVLEEKISYSYSEYKGIEFIHAWKRSRINFIVNSGSISFKDIANKTYTSDDIIRSTEHILNGWIVSLDENHLPVPNINLLLKRFEVTKRIYRSYDDNFRPFDKLDFKRSMLYLKFGCVLVLSYRNTSKLQYLNALLKLDDILCSLFPNFNKEEKKIMSWILENELSFIDNLVQTLNIKSSYNESNYFSSRKRNPIK